MRTEYYVGTHLLLGGDVVTDFEENVIDGVIEEIIYENEDTGYRVFSVNCDGILTTAVATCPQLFAGETITASGEWKNHSAYGRQFVCDEIEKTFPYELDGMLKFLSSGAVKGVGPSTAQRIVDTFKEDSFYIIENEPDRLVQIRGISSEKAQMISASFKSTLGVRDIMMQLAQYSISPNMAVKIYNKFGGFSLDIINTDPYRLWEEIEEFPFQSSDKIALENGLFYDSELRLGYFIKYILIHNLTNGHSFLPDTKLIEIAAENVGVSIEDATEAVNKQINTGKLFALNINNIRAIYLPAYFTAENYVAQKLLEISRYNSEPINDIYKHISFLEKQLNIEYAENQRKAIAASVENKAMVLTGGPGTGKTTTLKGIIKLFEGLGMTVSLCAPTGRAAKRLSEVCGKDAKTIHRLLEVEMGREQTFVKNESNPIKTDVVIVDEMSMVDIRLFESLLRAITPNMRLILVGDADQLPSVGAGNVFLDIIKSEKIHTVFLNEIFRQASMSKIITNAHKINRGEYPDLENSEDFFFIKKSSIESVNDAVVTLVTERIPKKYGKTVTSGLQVIIPTKKSPTGTQAINSLLRESINNPHESKTEATIKNTLYRVGDKVMQTKNNYDITCKKKNDVYETGVFNGDIGIISSIDQKNRQMRVDFDDRTAFYDFNDVDQLELAYAITVHKSQGSEFDVILLVISDMTPLLQYRNLLYTAVTRAKQLLIVVGNEQVINNMVDNNKRTGRYSGLKHLINKYFSVN